jgi:hypothetical protein
MLRQSILSFLLALAVLSGSLLPVASGAAQSLHQLRWIPPEDKDIAGYRVYLRSSLESFSEFIDLGLPSSGSDGVASGSITLDFRDGDLFAVMTAYDYADNESGFSNEILIKAPDSGEEVPAAPDDGALGDLLLIEDFESYSAGEDPPGWLDTEEGCGFEQDEPLFKTFLLTDDSVAFGTQLSGYHVHSHFVGGQSHTWSAYEFSGRMLLSSLSGGVGVTFMSDYPNSDSYYRLRTIFGSTFHVAPHPDANWDERRMCLGTTDTGVTPVANQWYSFRVQVDSRGPATQVRGRLWHSSDNEPDRWQFECVESGADRLTQGTVGFWAFEPGGQYWDDLEVRALDASGTGGCDPFACNDGNPCTSDSCDMSGCSNLPEPDGTVCNDGNSNTVNDVCIKGSCEGIIPACTSDAHCNDGNFCNGEELCQDLNCVPTAPQPDGTPCDDGDPTTQTDQCQSSICQGMDESRPEEEQDLCDTLICDDGDSCTIDSCVASACTHENAANGTPCDDGNESTTNDKCSNGICRGISPRCSTNKDCNDGNRWNGKELCKLSKCVPGVPRRPTPPLLLD